MTEPTQEQKDDEAWLAILAGHEGAPADGIAAAQATMLRKALQKRQARIEASFPVDDPALFSRILEAVHDDRSESWPPSSVEQSDPSLPVAPGIPAADYSALIVPSVWRSARTKVDTPASSGMDEIEIPAFLRKEAGKEQISQPIEERAPGISRPAQGLYSGTDDQPVMSHAPRGPADFGGAPRGRRIWAWGVAASITLATVVSWTLLIDNGVDESQVLRGPKDTILIDSDPAARLAQLRPLLEGAGSKPEVRIEKSGTVVITVAETPQVLDALTAERIFPQPVGGKIVLVIEKPAQRKP